jgi:hypothetical protein
MGRRNATTDRNARLTVVIITQVYQEDCLPFTLFFSFAVVPLLVAMLYTFSSWSARKRERCRLIGSQRLEVVHSRVDEWVN